MTAHQEKPTNSRSRNSRRKGSGHADERSRRTRKVRLRGGLVTLAVLAAAGCGVVAWLPSAEHRSPTAAATEAGGADAEPTPSSSQRAVEPTESSPSVTSKPELPEESEELTDGEGERDEKEGKDGKGSGEEREGQLDESDIPLSGPGTFVVAPGVSEKAGKGTTLRYRVEVETGLQLSVGETAEEVERILADPRGWTADGKSGFERVSSGPTDFVVKVATPGTVDKICGEYGLDTGGSVNCSVAQNVMVNLKRWLLATPVYAKDVEAYRALIVNHEVGHFLGHGHVTCPGEGEPAPAMMQQIKGMLGCAPNVWPYDAEGRLITGPSVP
ncbi:DUF3152 domain-containing protein [Streptomyces sp. NPDC002920]